MSGKDFLQKLLDGERVEWKALGEVAEYAGARIDPGQVNQENYVGVDNLLQNRAGKTHSSYVPTEGRLIEYRPGDVLIGNIRPYLKKIWLANQSGGTNGDVLVIRRTHPSLSPGYLYQALSDDKFFAYNMQHAKGAKMPRGDKAKILEYQIPIPCPDNPKKSLAIQSEIVRILDTFTELTAELTTELTARKKQYNYYRDRLLRFEDGEVEWKALGDVAEFRRGTAITHEQTTTGDIPVVANGPTPIYFHGESNRQGETIVIARSGAYAGYVSFWNQPIFLTDAFSIHPRADILKPKFVYHVLQNKQENIHAMKKGAGVPHVRVKEFELYDVPIPPLAEQARIVAILDKFDALTNSLTEGLPREIELRQKQYAYYRDLLFSFPKFPSSGEVPEGRSNAGDA
jgi:type I restriction enzyme S subunit